jgi:hypothetical protein
MDEQWQGVVEQLQALAETLSVKLPAEFEPAPEGQQPRGRLEIDPWFRETRRLNALEDFLEKANRKLAKKLPEEQEAKKSGSGS